METTRLSTRGQVIIPLPIRTTHQWAPGIEFAVVEMNDGILLTPIKPFKTTHIKNVLGCMDYKGPKKSLKDMEKGIARGAKKHDDRD